MWVRASEQRPNIFGKHENVCWHCKNAVAKCPWSRDFTPIEGWDAEPDGNTYKIRDCPLFEQIAVSVKSSKRRIKNSPKVKTRRCVNAI